MAAAPARPRTQRKPMSDTGFIVRIGIVCAVLALGVSLLVISANQESDAVPTIPDAIEAVSPAPNDIADPMTQIGVNLGDTFTGVLQFDGVEIPEDQLARIVELGEVTFNPGDGREFTEFDAGQHTVTVVYWHQTESRENDAHTFAWHFRVAA
jgi:hypothetical protein